MHDAPKCHTELALPRSASKLLISTLVVLLSECAYKRKKESLSTCCTSRDSPQNLALGLPRQSPSHRHVPRPTDVVLVAPSFLSVGSCLRVSATALHASLQCFQLVAASSKCSPSFSGVNCVVSASDNMQSVSIHLQMSVPSATLGHSVGPQWSTDNLTSAPPTCLSKGLDRDSQTLVSRLCHRWKNERAASAATVCCPDKLDGACASISYCLQIKV